tara:strand:+ start:535 stop:714 length:180 start_codon:yes stop_codon:yes gene_type:complete
MAIEKTITDDLGIKKATVKLTLPDIEIDVYCTNNDDKLNKEIKERLFDVVKYIIEKDIP